MCSARSLGSASSSSARARSSASSRPRRPGAGQRADRHRSRPRPGPGSPASCRSGEVAEREIEEERAGVDDPQHAVDVERVGRVSTWNRWLGTTWKISPALMYSWQWRTTSSYRSRVKFDSESGRDRRVGGDVADAQVGRRGREPVDQLVDAVAGGLVGGPGVEPGPTCAARRPGWSCGCGRRGPSGRRRRTRGRAGRGRPAGWRAGSRYSGRRHKPAKPTAPPVNRGRPGEVDGPVALEQPLELGERVGRGEPAGFRLAAGLDDRHLGPPRLEPEERLGPQEAEPADLLAADDALEKERRGRALDPAEGRDRRQPVAGQLPVDRDARGRESSSRANSS